MQAKTVIVAEVDTPPGSNESAGKHKAFSLRKGAPWLKTLLVQCAGAAGRQRDSYFRAQFLRLKSRRGPKKAAGARGHATS